LFSLVPSCERPTPKAKTTKTVHKIVVSGSGTAFPLISLLAKAFEEENPNVKFRFLPTVHSSGGIKGVSQSTLDIGMVSRPLKPDEKRLGLKYYVFSQDGLAVATHKSVAIKNLTSTQLKEIYQGKITNWQEVGGPDQEIVVLDRNEDESAKIILRQYVLGPVDKLKVTKKAVILYYEPDMVSGLKETPYAIGYLSLGYAISRKLAINLLNLDGVAPTVENILAGKYRIVRPLGVVVKKNPGEVVKKFIKFCLSNKASLLMRRNGFAPAKEMAK
jgi:phosphate transport system substrate-binding protein